MRIRFRIEPAPSFLKIFGAKDQIVVQVQEVFTGYSETGSELLGSLTRWRDATPEDMIHVHEGTVN